MCHARFHASDKTVMAVMSNMAWHVLLQCTQWHITFKSSLCCFFVISVVARRIFTFV